MFISSFFLTQLRAKKRLEFQLVLGHPALTFCLPKLMILLEDDFPEPLSIGQVKL